ncbi:hypothetical protein ACSVBT_02045 [Afipia sp. TerB]
MIGAARKSGSENEKNLTQDRIAAGRAGTKGEMKNKKMMIPRIKDDHALFFPLRTNRAAQRSDHAVATTARNLQRARRP